MSGEKIGKYPPESAGNPTLNIERMAFSPLFREQADRVLAGLNSSPKAITYLLLATSPTDVQLKDAFAAHYVGTPLEKRPDASVQFVRKSLIPNGLAVEETVVQNGRRETTFSQTEEIQAVGEAVSTNLVLFEADSGISLYSFFGKVHSNKDTSSLKSPLTRAMLLMMIAGGTQTVADLGQLVGKGAVGTQLMNLAQSGFIKYDSLHTVTGARQLEYGTTPAGIEKMEKAFALKDTDIATIARTCVTLAQLGIPISQSNVYIHLPEEIKTRWQKYPLQNSITKYLREFAAKGYLEKSKFIGSKKHSEAIVTEKGELVIDGFLNPFIGAMQSERMLHEWRQEAVARVQGDLPTYAQVTAQLFYPNSQAEKLAKYEQYRKGILTAVLFHSGITIYELSEMLSVPRTSMAGYLSELASVGQLVQYKDFHGVNRYDLSSRTAQEPVAFVVKELKKKKSRLKQAATKIRLDIYNEERRLKNRTKRLQKTEAVVVSFVQGEEEALRQKAGRLDAIQTAIQRRELDDRARRLQYAEDSLVAHLAEEETRLKQRGKRLDSVAKKLNRKKEVDEEEKRAERGRQANERQFIQARQIKESSIVLDQCPDDRTNSLWIIYQAFARNPAYGIKFYAEENDRFTVRTVHAEMEPIIQQTLAILKSSPSNVWEVLDAIDKGEPERIFAFINPLDERPVAKKGGELFDFDEILQYRQRAFLIAYEKKVREDKGAIGLDIQSQYTHLMRGYQGNSPERLVEMIEIFLREIRNRNKHLDPSRILNKV